MKTIALVQPAYSYDGKSQVYLPGGLINLGSRLISAGLDVSFTDLNLEQLTDQTVLSRLGKSDIIGFTLIGPLYVSVVMRHIRRLRGLGFCQPILLGGQGVARVRCADFCSWFGFDPHVYQVRNDADLTRHLGIEASLLPTAYTVSGARMMERIDGLLLRMYLTSEFCLFLSQGCIYDCRFCAAEKGRQEQYRSMSALVDELNFICRKLQEYECGEIQVYLSNLDTFQTPQKIEEAFEAIRLVTERYGIQPRIRGLATVRCTYRAVWNDPGLVGKLRARGLEMIAFGADGSTEATWKRQNKRHNSLSELDVVVNAMRDEGVTVELLMVIGFPDDTIGDMLNNLMYSFGKAFQGVVIRPYLAKECTPSGNWPEDDVGVAYFREHPEELDALDYAALGSVHTHPVWWNRWVANTVYLTVICVLWPLGLCPTRPIMPSGEGGCIRRFIARWINKTMPADR